MQAPGPADPVVHTSPGTTLLLLGTIIQGSETVLEDTVAHWATYTAALQTLRALTCHTVRDKAEKLISIRSLCHTLLPILLGPNALQRCY